MPSTQPKRYNGVRTAAGRMVDPREGVALNVERLRLRIPRAMDYAEGLPVGVSGQVHQHLAAAAASIDAALDLTRGAR